MYEAVAALLTFNASIYFATGTSPRRRGNEHPTIVPYETFEAADGWINLGVANDELWQRFCKAADREDLRDRFALREGRRSRPQSRRPRSDSSKTIMAQRTRNEWLALLDQQGMPCGAIRTVAEVCESEVLKSRDMIAEMPHASAGIVKGIKSAIHLGDTPLDSYIAPPALGQHTNELLQDLLGLTEDEIAGSAPER